MSRWIICVGAVVCALMLLFAAGSIPTNARQAQTPQVITAQAATVVPVVPGDGSDGDAPPGFRQPYGLVLTLRDNGRSFTIPLNSRIYLRIPRLPVTHLVYDYRILMPDNIYPQPYDAPDEIPPAPAQDSTIEPFPVTPMPLPPSSIMPPFTWRLVAIAPGTTSLSLVATPCPPERPCPMTPIYDFSVTITVRGGIVPPPPVEPPNYPPVYSDVYIGTAYLDQTIPVQVGQVLALELPFLAPQEPVTLSFDSSVLQPLPGQDLTHPRSGGWRFRVIGSGTTTITVQGKRCLDGSADCTPSLLFRVTVTSGAGGSTNPGPR